MKKILLIFLFPSFSWAGTSLTSQDFQFPINLLSTISVVNQDSNGYSARFSSSVFLGGNVRFGDGTVLTSSASIPSASTQTFVDTTSTQVVNGNKTFIGVSTFTGNVYSLFNSSQAALNGLCIGGCAASGNNLQITCINGSTIIFSTNGNPIFISFVGMIDNSTAGDGTVISVVVDQTAYPIVNYTAATGMGGVQVSGNYFGPIPPNSTANNFFTPSIGSHTFCLGLGNLTGGTSHIYGIGNNASFAGVIFRVIQMPGGI